MTRLAPAIAAAALSMLLGGCAQPDTAAPLASAVAGQSILANSKPANGATVAGPVNQLELWFSPPAQLGEATVTGPDGMMPMMVTAVGQVGYYSLPLSGLGRGRYTVTWKAAAAGTTYQGSFQFEVR